ncbi:MAG: hypothetical protein IKJ98_09445, partial [Bacteroidales bacterium]|nr:hypothetical protein [Bacteroidales bacterium]
MKRLTLLLCTLGLTVSLFAQKELTISGGNSVSAMVCQNSVLYVWGSNKNESTTGLLGVSSTAAYEPMPKEVTFFTSQDIYIQQVNCGSGSHFIALDCAGRVWCWGNNSLGQCGTGTIPNAQGTVQSTPVQVKTGNGDLSGTAYSDGGYLVNVDVVYAGNNNSFAILGDGPYKGRLVGWGGNNKGFDSQGYDDAYGQLGCGNQNNQPYPKFVITPNGNPLEGVVQVYAGDNCAYALVDPDGDGVGTVYSWGHQKSNGSLGRSANGGTGSNDADIRDPYARPVIMENGTPLSNITMLGCGDGEGYGLDVDGYIWSWGNSSWNNAGGIMDANTGWIGTNGIPKRVAAGETTGASNDGTYLLAKWVAGGQGFGMAITADNKPVAWGGGGCGDGGATGNGTLNGSSATQHGAQYIKATGGIVYDDVVLINRADTWGFFGRGDGSMYAWGCNPVGQLGIGSTTSQAYATKINPPTNCNPRHPDPTVSMTPSTDITVCESAFDGIELDAGFVIGLELAKYYNIKWYKDGSEISGTSGTVAEKGTTYMAMTPGTYKVEITHKEDGTGNGCVSYEPATGEITIDTYKQTYTIPDMTYCPGNDSLEVKVNAASGSKAIYSWYYSDAENAPAIATTVGSGTTNLYIGDDAVRPKNGKKTIYVEETSAGVGTFIPSSFANGSSTQSISQQNNIANPGFTVNSAVTLRSFKLKAQGAMQSYYVNGSATLSGTITFTANLCNPKTDNGHVVANKTSVIKSFTGTMTMQKEITATGTYKFTEVVTFDCGNYELKPGTYYLVFSGATKTGDADANNSVVYYTSKGLVGVKDTYTGTYIEGIGAAQDNNFQTNQTGVFFDIDFATPQGFCDRIPIEIPQECPCDAPDDVVINCDDASFVTNDTIYICENNARCTLTTDAWAASSASNKFSYQWFKDGASSTAVSSGNTSTSYSVTDAGKYKVVAYFSSTGRSVTACADSAEVTVLLNPVPTVKVSGGGEFCEGNEASFTSPVTFTMTGEPKFRVYWSYTDPTGTTKTKNKRSTAYDVEADIPTTVGEHVYTVTSVNDDGNCKNENVTGTAKVIVKPKPTASIVVDPTSATICEGSGAVSLTAGCDPTGDVTYAWTKDNSNSGSGAGKSLTAPSESGVYAVTATLNGCTSDPVSQEVTINPKPEIKTLTSDKSAVCSGASITLTATVSDAGDGTFEWSGDGVTGNGATATVTNDVTTDTEVTITLNYTGKEGCEAEAKTIKVTFYAYPDAPTVKDQAYCVDDTPKQLEGTAMSGATLNWYGTSATGGTASSTAPTPSTASAGETFYYVSQTINGCESKTRAMATVTVDDTLAPVITADPGFEVCENAPIALNVEGSFRSTVWSGSGASSLDATTIQSPTFAATKGSYDVIVKVEDTKGCKGSAKKTITINPIPEITQLSQLTNKCVSDETAQTITATVTPSGISGTGTWTGDVTNPANTSASYTPSVAGVGTHTILYDFVSDKGCVAEQKSTSVEVFDMPNPSISLSKNSVCEEGQNSEVVTVTSQGTAATGTFVYSVNNGGTVDASTGAFDPTQNKPTSGTETVYTIKLAYTDANQCYGEATADVTVHKLPTVTILTTNPTELCYNGAAINIATNVAPAGGVGEWTGTESQTSDKFDPSVKTVGANAITYTYTDTYQCQNSDDYSIEVKKPAVPTAGDDVNAMINAGNLVGKDAMTATMNTPADVLQWMPATGGSVITEGTSYTSPETEVGSYHYAIRAMLTVNGAGCYSDSVIATTNISKCNAMAPKSSDIYVCVGGDMKSFSAVQTSTLTNQKISWLSDNPVGKNGTEADSWILKDNNTSFEPTGVNTSVAGDYVYYAAEYDGIESCWSAGTKVTLHVVDNPVVTISSPENICAKGSDVVPVTVNPQNGSLSANVGTMNGFQWLPGDYTGDKEEVTFSYTVTSEPYADGTTCQTTVESNTTAHFMEAPTGSETNWLIGNIDGITTGLLTGTRTSTGQTITWYDTQSKTNVLQASGDAFTPDKAALKAEVGSAATYVKKYWITQTDAYTCESEPAEVILNLIDCPWEAPTVSGDEKCLNIALDPLRGTEGASVATDSKNGVTKWNWYNESKSLITTTTSSEYAHGVSQATAGTTTFWVSYSADEKNSGNECESPMTQVTVTVLPLPTVTFDKQEEIVCYTTEELKINVKATSENGVGTGAWTISEGDASAISSNGIFYPQKNGKNEGQKQYTLTYTYTDAKSCVSDNSRTVDVIYLPAPETRGFYAMTTQSNPVEVKVTSTMTQGASAKWFDSETLVNNELGTGTTWATGDATSQTIDKNYYARQYKEGCYSESTVANVKIVPCPIPSVVISDEKACNYEEVPTLAASTGDWAERDGSSSIFKFYNESSTLEKSSADGTYKPSLTREGEFKYYVSEYSSMPLQNLTVSEGCEGPKKLATIKITGTGMPTITSSINPAEVCEGETNPTFTATNIIGTVGWYEEDPGALGVPETAQMGAEKSFVPTGRVADTYTIWAVMFADGCYGPKVPATYTVKDIPVAPTVKDTAICYGEANERVSVVEDATTARTINWYAEASKSGNVLGTGNSYLSKETSVGTYTYYAAQSVKGCEGPTAPAKFKIKPLPSAPVMTNQPNICEYDAAPILHAGGENITWYDNDKVTVLGSETEYQTTDITTGTKRYYATQTVDGCEGQQATITYVVNAKPANPEVQGANVCEGDEEIPSLTTNMSMDKWYADESALTYLTTGYTYTPAFSEVGNSDKTYYVQRELNNCLSDIMPVVLHVVPKPRFAISNDTTLCIYDDVVTLEAFNFSPAMNDESSVKWQIKKGNVTRIFDEEENHTLTPVTVITSEGDYAVSATYKYVYDNIYCTSDTIGMKYSIKGRARTPIVFSSVICQGDEIKDLRALGSPNMVWGSLDGTMPVVAYGQKYEFQK